jgi:predicted esterase
MNVSHLKISNSLTFSFVGPPLEKGAKHTVFYFALSAKDTLETSPYNQPVQFLQSENVRIFTVTLPGHEDPRRPEDALPFWAEQFKEGHDLLTPFFHQVKEGISTLLEKGVIIEKSFAMMGLSRGAFVAAHLAALCPSVKALLGFAPLIRLSKASSFDNVPNISPFNLEHLKPHLYNRNIRFYIGNRDTLVQTQYVFDFIHQLADTAYEARIRSSPIELMIGPSIGRHGHGTSPETFEAGTLWLKELWEKA